jgi:hypothetical protein
MEDDVVGDDERARLGLLAREYEQLLVEAVRDVEEDDVEHVVDLRQRLTCVAFDEQRRLLEPRLGDVPPPVGDAALLALEGEDAAAEVAESVCGATSEKRNRPVAGATVTPGGRGSSRSSRSSTPRTRSSSTVPSLSFEPCGPS